MLILVYALNVMKMKLLEVLCGIAALGFVLWSPPLVAEENGNQTPIIPKSLKNQSHTNELFKTIIDRNSGRYAVVSTNKQVLTAKDLSGRALWSTNIMEGIKPLITHVPKLQGRSIEGLQIRNGEIWINLGRGYAIVESESGKIKGLSVR
jgi:hypothetical protein